MWPFSAKKTPIEIQHKNPSGLFSTHGRAPGIGHNGGPALDWPEPVQSMPEGVGMDDEENAYDSVKPIYGNGYAGVPDAQLNWYAAQSFIGYQMCALLSQHWLIDKACSMPGKDAVRKGWNLTVNDGSEVDPATLKRIGKIDKRMKTKWHLQEYLRKGRIFGIRIMMFKVNSPDPDYYKKPFNIDGVGVGQYKGMVQIDPYWITPELMSQNLINPTNLHFYEPEFWRVAGAGIIHRSHLVVFTTGQVPDVLKPSYYYGGVSLCQAIYERVYAAERTANEAPMLAMTKRLTVLSTDLEEAIANEATFTERMEWWRNTRDNYGVKINGLDDKLEQFDLTLTDLDNVIMTQYQLVAMIAGVPGTKLLGTQPKGFNSTGDYEEASYHEFLETMQENDLTPVLDMHYALVCKSFSLNIEIDVDWNELDAMTAQEQATVNATKAATGAALVSTGAIEAQDERNRLIADKDSGYNGLSPDVPPMPDDPMGGGEPAPPGGTKAAAAAYAAKLPAPKQTAPKGA